MKEKTLEKYMYRFCVDLLFYSNCPKSMQTVSLIEKIIGDSEILWNYLDTTIFYAEINVKSECVLFPAVAYILTLFKIEKREQVDQSILDEITVENLIFKLALFARSQEAKAYFDL